MTAPQKSGNIKINLENSVVRKDMIEQLGVYAAKKELSVKDFTALLGRVDDLTVKLARLKQEKDNAKKAFEEKLIEIDKKTKELQKTCLHESTNYCPDASGNNDSHTYCNLCDKEV